MRKDFEKYDELDNKHNIHRLLIQLDKKLRSINSKDKLEEWEKGFEDYASLFEPVYKKNSIDNFQNIKNAIMNNATYQYKYNNLMLIIFIIGPYCLFHKRYDFIKHLWEYKQPPDSDATWTGDHIIPESPSELIDIYFTKLDRKKIRMFREDRHGMEKYLKEYFILLLAWYFIAKAEPLNNISIDIANFDLPDYDSYVLNNIIHSVEELKQTANSLKSQHEIWSELGFEKERTNHLLGNEIIKFLDALKSKAEGKIDESKLETKISEKKIKIVKDKTIEEFYKMSSLRQIFRNFQCFSDKTDIEYKGELGRQGLNLVYDKEAFFDDWYVDYSFGGYNFGNDLAAIENQVISLKLSSFCEKHEFCKNFEDVLTKFSAPNNMVIIALNVFTDRLFEKDINYVPQWKLSENEILNITGFDGFYKFEGNQIPVIGVFDGLKIKRIIIIDLKNSVELVQYSPLNKVDDKKLKEVIFYMFIDAFSDNERLLNDLLDKPPEWLKKMGSVEEQKKYLLKKVSIKIYERFELLKKSAFRGYIMDIPDSLDFDVL